MKRRTMVICGLGMALHGVAQAAWPDKPLRILVPGLAGSPADVAVRAVSEFLAASLGQPIVVENRGGGMGVLGMGIVAGSPGDGHVFGAMNLQLAAVPALRKSMPFDLGKLVPVSQLTLEGPVLAVHAELPVRSMAELISYLKAKGGEVPYGSAGVASPSHLGMELLLRRVGAAARHIPFGGAAAAATGLAGGQIGVAMMGSASVLPVAATGRVRAIAVSADTRMDKLPAVPTFAESGFGDIDVQGWVGLVAPAGTPPMVVERVNAAVNAALRDPAVRQRLIGVGSLPRGGSADEFARFMLAEMARWQEVVRVSQIQAD